MGKIKNLEAVATSPLRRSVLEVLEVGLEAIDTKAVIRSQVKKVSTDLVIAGETIARASFDRLLVVGVGKCSSAAAAALEEQLGDVIAGGIVVDVRCEEELKYIKGCEGSHPFPTEKNVDFTRQIIELLKSVTERDLVLMIISGGGSVLLCQPARPDDSGRSGGPNNHTCEDETLLINTLFNAGATIAELNTIRKHISLARGGYLAEYAYPARVISLVFSDVVGNDLSVIASGPTVKDPTTVADALALGQKYKLNLDGQLVETPKDQKFFDRVRNVLVASNSLMLEAMAKAGEAKGFKTFICTDCLAGEARVNGERIAGELNSQDPKTMLLYGGETTVTLHGHGKGGRNRELALGALTKLSPNSVLAALASDGKDFTQRAGAIIDSTTLARAQELNIDPVVYSRDNNSHAFFERVGDYLDTGHTGSNVADIIVAAKGA